MVKGKYKIIVVDDHEMFRDALKSLLEQEEIAEVIAEAENGQELLNLLETLNPDLVLMDIDMPLMDGITATEKAIALKPDINILILSMFGDEDHYQRLINAGAKGFVLKSSGKTELENGIRAVAEGDNYFSSELLRKIIININKFQTDKDKTKTTSKSLLEELDLTDRELETLKLLCNGFSTTEIAEKLFLSTKTIEFYRSKLLQKTESKNTVNLVLYAIKNKIVSV